MSSDIQPTATPDTFLETRRKEMHKLIDDFFFEASVGTYSETLTELLSDFVGHAKGAKHSYLCNKVYYTCKTITFLTQLSEAFKMIENLTPKTN